MMDINELIKGLEKEDISTADKINMFVMLCNGEVLKKQLVAHAMMVKIGLTQADMVHSFAFGILRLARPDLFEEQNDD